MPRPKKEECKHANHLTRLQSIKDESHKHSPNYLSPYRIPLNSLDLNVVSSNYMPTIVHKGEEDGGSIISTAIQSAENMKSMAVKYGVHIS
jgi:hypothetical protein